MFPYKFRVLICLVSCAHLLNLLHVCRVSLEVLDCSSDTLVHIPGQAVKIVEIRILKNFCLFLGQAPRIISAAAHIRPPPIADPPFTSLWNFKTLGCQTRRPYVYILVYIYIYNIYWES